MSILRPVDPAEVADLARRFGEPVRAVHALPFLPLVPAKRVKRRGEVVFGLRDAAGRVLLHTKSFYPAGVFRLPGGGIDWNERLEHALLREAREETALDVQIRKFVALIEYDIEGQRAAFPTYLFLLDTADLSAAQSGDPGESITAFRPVDAAGLRTTARDLRALPGDWRVWGEFRAIAHDQLAALLGA
ncbi:MAG: NUDIX hydrolase [Chloroflexi bacterium]|nr:NUDIX hydrolase [Chloroflexota bacterium]